MPRNKVEESLCYFSPAVCRRPEPLSHSAKAMFELLKSRGPYASDSTLRMNSTKYLCLLFALLLKFN